MRFLRPAAIVAKNDTMRIRMVAVPLIGTVEEVMVDCPTGSSWTVRVEPFALAETVVTRGLWDDVHGVAGDPEMSNFPKTDLSWRDAIRFCNALSEREGLEPVYQISQRDVPQPAPTRWRPHSEPELDDWIVAWDHGADGYRLPTDAEWQVACRAGTSGARYGRLDDIAWYVENSGGTVHPVRSKEPNAWGLFDLLGGVWEWCWDLYDPESYGSYRIIRGGGWSDPQWSCRSGVRRKTNPTASFDDLGFRVAQGAVSAPAVRPG
ncbi:hypothetical protein HMPREF1531_02516 [Propionibacterium sp. oral taxon 192 str. F0372]|nr:hypothetical protein HMPREF1531_02516 [Propionibacterium sp. oral taxon 192 str. F0372]